MNKFLLRKESRRGMALVIVLGLIALLIISSVTFAILMRVERASAANTRNTTMARQSLKSALAFALADLDKSITNELNPNWSYPGYPELPFWDVKTRPPKGKPPREDPDSRDVHFWRDTFGSVDYTIEKGNTAARASLMSYGLEKFVPKFIRHKAVATAMRRSDYNGAIPPKYAGTGEHLISEVGAEWIPVYANNDTDDIVGRYAYLAFKTTDYFDLSSLCNTPAKTRWMGYSPAELTLPNDSFDETAFKKHFPKAQGSFSKTLRGEIKADRFDSYADVDAYVGDVFAEGAAYSTYSYSPPETNKFFFFGTTPEEQVKHIKKHKATIMEAFYDCGLTESSEDYNRNHGRKDVIRDEFSGDCKECGLPAQTLPKDKHSEQALWAYLGLIDYLDEDDEPEGKDDYEKFARPATEETPLFNGFMATVEIERSEAFETIEVVSRYDGDGNPIKQEKEVFDGTKFIYTVRVNGKVVFANRSVASRNEQIMTSFVEGRLGISFEGGAPWDDDNKFFAKDIAAQVSGKGDFDEYDIDRGLYLEKKSFEGTPLIFEDGSVVFNELTISNTVSVADPANPLKWDDTDFFKDSKTFSFPEVIRVGAAGRAYSYADENLVIHQSPPASYDEKEIAGGWWVSSSLSAEKEKIGLYGKGTPNAGNRGCFVEDGKPVFKDKAAAQSEAATPQKAPANAANAYKLKTWRATAILFANMMDPRFQHYSSAEYQDIGTTPIVAVPSHNEELNEGNELYDYLSISRLAIKPDGDKIVGGTLANYYKAIDGQNYDDANATFTQFVNDFKSDPYYFGGYFVTDDDSYSGYSLFQKYLFGNADNLVNLFGGHIDGSRLAREFENGHEFENAEMVDDFQSIWSSAYAKNGNPEDFNDKGDEYSILQTPGELGYLPIGPFATIRLTGFKGESDYLTYKEETALFNKLPKDTPFHKVLDYFTTRSDAKGLVNLNTSDGILLKSVFSGMPIKTDDFDNVPNNTGGKKINENEYLVIKPEIANDIADAFKETRNDHFNGKAISNISDLGWIFDRDPMETLLDPLDVPILRSADREAIIRNSCNLFTTRGQTYTIIMRGEAYSPLFGRTTVGDGDGTTLAARTAIATVWRDSEPDAKGTYPIRLIFFKILDE